MREVIAGEPVTASALLFPSPVTRGRITGWTYLVANLRQAAASISVSTTCAGRS
jgi:hypothetical protein